MESRAILELLRGIAAKQDAAGVTSSWLIVDNGEVVGLCGFKGLPADDAAEFGYGVAESRRRRGHASIAVTRLVDAVQREGHLSVLCAETAVWNVASQAVLEKNGFVRTGERHDAEDGDLYVWERALTS